MEFLSYIAKFFQQLFEWWFTVMPWEQAILVRRGKHVKNLGAGFYFKIPFLDTVYMQTVRTRMVDIPMQTMSTKDGQTITIKSFMSYAIEDINKLYQTLYHPEMTLASLAMGKIGEVIRDNDVKEITPGKIEEAVNGQIKSEDYGLKDVIVKITTFAIVRSYRIMQEGSYLQEGLNMSPKKSTN